MEIKHYIFIVFKDHLLHILLHYIVKYKSGASPPLALPPACISAPTEFALPPASRIATPPASGSATPLACPHPSSSPPSSPLVTVSFYFTCPSKSKSNRKNKYYIKSYIHIKRLKVLYQKIILFIIEN